MTRVSEEEKGRTFSEFHDPNRMIRQIAQARKGNKSEDYSSEAVRTSSARTVDEHMNVAKRVLELFGKRTAAKSK